MAAKIRTTATNNPSEDAYRSYRSYRSFPVRLRDLSFFFPIPLPKPLLIRQLRPRLPILYT